MVSDKITEYRIKLLHPSVRDAFRYFIEEAERRLIISLRIVQGLRTFAEQDALYAQGRTTPGPIVTYSPAGASYHNYGLAVDVAPLIYGGQKLDWNYDFNKLAPIGALYGLTWGGNFIKLKDLDHFEKNMGYNWRTLLDLHNRKKFIEGTEYVNI